MDRDTLTVRIDGEPFLSRARLFRERTHATRLAWSEFARSRGATSFRVGSLGMVFAVGTKVPMGWKKPTSRRFSQPTEGHPDVELIAALPRAPSSAEVFGDTLLHDLAYDSGDGGRGYAGIGYLFGGPAIGWTSKGATFVATIPDARSAAARHLVANPTHVITNGADTWTLPDGLVRISAAERDLVFAQDAVALERTKAAA